MAHNATFDMGFINAEYERLGIAPVPAERVTDTLALARRKHPMGPNSLDALCRRYGIDNSHRTKHGALLDSELLAEVYIEMIGGRQAALGLGVAERRETLDAADGEEIVLPVRERPRPLPDRISPAEIAAHAAMVEKIGAKAIWLKYDQQELIGLKRKTPGWAGRFTGRRIKRSVGRARRPWPSAVPRPCAAGTSGRSRSGRSSAAGSRRCGSRRQ